MAIGPKEQVKNANTAVLASAIELGSQAIMGALGNDISDQQGDSVVSVDFVRTAVAARLKNVLVPRLINHN